MFLLFLIIFGIDSCNIYVHLHLSFLKVSEYWPDGHVILVGTVKFVSTASGAARLKVELKNPHHRVCTIL